MSVILRNAGFNDLKTYKVTIYPEIEFIYQQIWNKFGFNAFVELTFSCKLAHMYCVCWADDKPNLIILFKILNE